MVVLRRVFRQIPATAQANARIDLFAALLFGAFAGLTFPFIPVMGRRLGALGAPVALRPPGPPGGLAAGPRAVPLPAHAVRPDAGRVCDVSPALSWDCFHRVAAFFTFGFGVWMTGPAIPILLVDDLRATNFQVGLLGAITAGMSVLAYIQWGR